MAPTSEVKLVTVLFLVGMVVRNVGGYSPHTDVYAPHPNVGYPAGLIPNCPGVMKNATISSGKLPLLRLVLHRIDETGQLVRKSMPISSAARSVAKEKHVDLKNRRTVVYAVGFWDSSMFPQNQAIASAYCKKGYNVFVSETFNFLTNIYPKSVRLSRVIGKKIGEFLANLVSQGLTADKLELVGISLGSHIVAYAAKRFFTLTGQKPYRITGLDPAGPCFRALPSHLKLNSTDAQRVDIIHTNIDGFGTAEPMGTVDFYVNGGEYQPSDVPYIPCLVICSHVKSIFYWWQAIEHPKKFIGVQCDSVQDARYANCYNNTLTNYLGLETRFDRPGIFYLSTSNEFPYYRGKEGLKPENEIYTSIIRKMNEDDNFEA